MSTDEDWVPDREAVDALVELLPAIESAPP